MILKGESNVMLVQAAKVNRTVIFINLLIVGIVISLSCTVRTFPVFPLVDFSSCLIEFVCASDIIAVCFWEFIPLIKNFKIKFREYFG